MPGKVPDRGDRHIKYSDELIGMIKWIINRDRRERHKAGFKYQTFGLVKRLSEEFGVNYWTVKEIKERRRRKTTRQTYLMDTVRLYEPDQLDQIRQQRILKKRIGASWKGLMPTRHYHSGSYKKLLHRLGKPIGDDSR
jgi:hypothetical protein